MTKVRVAINGFGRIGRSAAKILLEKEDLELVAINDLADNDVLAHLLKYDTAYGRYDKKVTATKDSISIDGKNIPVFEERDPEKLPWKKLKIDVVLESTGVFTKDGAAKAHLKAGARRVIVSAPTKGSGGIKTYLLGVNTDEYKDEEVISNASCTTNCIGPVISVMMENFGIEKALMTTIHGYTSTQNLQDGPHKDLRRARAAAANIIPTTTGAAVATTEAIPELTGKFDGLSVRVPVITGSLTDFTLLLKKKTTVEEINRAFEEAEKMPRYRGIMRTTKDPIVSSDIIGDTHSSIVDLAMTRLVDGDMVKVFAWYDNEWGYANRLVEQIKIVSR